MHHVCSWSGEIPARRVASLVGSSRDSSKKARVCALPQPAAGSHRAVPALVLTHPTQLTGTIDHGYGWRCQGLPCILGTFGQDLITESGTCPLHCASLALCPVGLIMPLLVLWLRGWQVASGVCVDLRCVLRSVSIALGFPALPKSPLSLDGAL